MRAKQIRPLSLAFAFFLSLGTAHADGQVDWPHSPPATEQTDSAALRALFGTLAADPHKDIKGIVILRHNQLVAESYFNGDNADTLHDIRSATKSITATLMGIAIEHHFIHSVDDPISDYLPGLPKDKQQIAIRDLLNMRSGLDADDTGPSTPGNEDRLDESTDWIKTVYAVPMKRPPGQAYLYCSINAFLRVRSSRMLQNSLWTSSQNSNSSILSESTSSHGDMFPSTASQAREIYASPHATKQGPVSSFSKTEGSTAIRS